MPNTYSQIYIHVVFAVKGRQSLIKPDWEDELFQYITGIIRNYGQKLLAINGAADHIHILISISPYCNLSDLVREIKKSSNTFIKNKKFTPFHFQWQEGFGAFSCSHSALEKVIRYINGQKEHHQKQRFEDEYISFLRNYDISFDKRYLFEWIL